MCVSSKLIDIGVLSKPSVRMRVTLTIEQSISPVPNCWTWKLLAQSHTKLPQYP